MNPDIIRMSDKKVILVIYIIVFTGTYVIACCRITGPTISNVIDAQEVSASRCRHIPADISQTRSDRTLRLEICGRRYWYTRRCRNPGSSWWYRRRCRCGSRNWCICRRGIIGKCSCWAWKSSYTVCIGTYFYSP